MNTRPILSLPKSSHQPAEVFPGLRLGTQALAKQSAPGFRRRLEPAKPVCGTDIFDTSDGGLVTVAGTGAGKGVSQVVPTLLTYPGSIIVTDPKGELCSITAARRREMGQRVFHIDPFGQGETDALNPFSNIRAFGPDAPDQCAALAAQIAPQSAQGDPFWDNCARRLIMGTCLFIATYLSPKYRNLSTLARIWNSGENRLSEYIAVMKQSSFYSGIIQDAAALYEDAPDKTRGSILTCVREPLTFLLSRRGARSLSGNEVPLELLKSGQPFTIFLRVPPPQLLAQARLLRVWLGTLISILAGRTQRPAIPDLLLVDEAAQVGQLDELLTAASLLRGYGLRCWTFWQSLGQLEGIWGPRHREFLDNASVLSMFGVANAASAAAVAELTGFEQEALIGLPSHRQVLALAGRKPMICDRINYLQDPVLARLALANPFHAPISGQGKEMRHG